MEHGQLVEALILFPLFLDVLADAGFVAPDGRDVVAPRPKVLPEEVLSAAKLRAGDVDGALALHESDDLRHGILRGNRQQHVHVVGEEMPLLHRTLLMLTAIRIERTDPIRRSVEIDGVPQVGD
ncbi:hypothetical protein MELA_02978 [Candidatus Methylomirabilis lanthanidiphila]|uniref:Uncharacterized protein n=1 Tax=Candidatus Methylomirabilis lanthanidiphila TaxID=2211376 RepID=A0A564ZMY3_9BACT|nr:hypothetical protein MELA_02978 [Candidatus Methylomirabilis lanthanidiphila]